MEEKINGNGEKTFIKVTNKDIYEKLHSHGEMLIEIDKKLTLVNGQIKLNKWVSRTALSLALVAIAALLKITFI